MRITSNIATHSDATQTLAAFNIDFQYSTENIYNLCEQGYNIIISDKDCTKYTEEYPNVTFIFPEATFPNYSLNYIKSFDSCQLVNNYPLLKKTNQCCIINQYQTNRLFVKRLQSMYDLDCYGAGFGYNEVKIDIKSTVQVYRNYDYCATVSEREMLKILALRKK